jgi:hypothetical protein
MDNAHVIAVGQPATMGRHVLNVRQASSYQRREIVEVFIHFLSY